MSIYIISLELGLTSKESGNGTCIIAVLGLSTLENLPDYGTTFHNYLTNSSWLGPNFIPTFILEPLRCLYGTFGPVLLPLGGFAGWSPESVANGIDLVYYSYSTSKFKYEISLEVIQNLQDPLELALRCHCKILKLVIEINDKLRDLAISWYRTLLVIYAPCQDVRMLM